jgi:hypothetical protein
VRERRHRARLALEALAQLGVAGEPLGQDLERDVAVERLVVRAVDLSHPARTEASGDAVMAEAGAGLERHRDRRRGVSREV